MGETPALPKNLSAEGIDLVKKCLQHDPKKRSTANNLLAHILRAQEDVSIIRIIILQFFSYIIIFFSLSWGYHKKN